MEEEWKKKWSLRKTVKPRTNMAVKIGMSQRMVHPWNSKSKGKENNNSKNYIVNQRGRA